MADFGLFLDGGLILLDGDDIAEEAFVDDAEDIVADGGEVPCAIWRVEGAGEIGEDIAINFEAIGEMILVEVAVVFGVHVAEGRGERVEKFAAFRADAGEGVAEGTVGDDAAVFAHAHEDHAVHDALDGFGVARGTV